MSAKSFRQSQAELHTWSGLLVGWILYLIFLNGTVSYWREEITRWTRPELAATENVQPALQGALAYLHNHAQQAESWTITLPSERQTGVIANWRNSGDRPRMRRDVLIGPDGNPSSARATEGGDFFYRLHFDLRYIPVIWGRWISGFCAMFMLVAIISGVITHKKIFADFFTFRPRKGQRSWLDGHNALAVLALPFHAMITYTGLITLMTIYVPWAVDANFEGRQAFFREITGASAEKIERSGTSTPLFPIDQLVRQAEDEWSTRAGWIQVERPGDLTARVIITRHNEASLNNDAMNIVFDGSNGTRLSATSPQSAAVATRGGMIGLHAGRFAPWTLRWLFFLSGVAGTAMIATGLVLWTAKRRARLPNPTKPPFGFWLVERLNIGTIAGLPLGMTGFLWANRLLPIGMAERAAWEVHASFLVWGIALLCAFIRPPYQTWPILFGATAIALVALPIFDLFATKSGLIDSLITGDMIMAGMQIGLAGTGVLFAGLALLTRSKASKATASHKHPRTISPVLSEAQP